MYVKPAPGRTVPDPQRADFLPADGREVPDNQWWNRRVEDNDVIVTDPPPVQAPVQGKATKTKEA